MEQLWQHHCALSDDDRETLQRIDDMNNHWGNYSFMDVLHAYGELDFLLKRSLLMMASQMSGIQAYAMLHKVWLHATEGLYPFFKENCLFPSPKDSVRLKDTIELGFFYPDKLLARPTPSAITVPVISIIMPVYRAQRYLWEALRSIYEQTFTDFELILINEYKNDDPLTAILQIFEDSRTVVVQKKEAARLGKSLNIGIEHARGEFIARMDADDIAHPERLQKQFDFFGSYPDIDLCGTQFRSFGIMNTWANKPLPTTHSEIQCRSLKYCSFLHPTVMWRKEKLNEHRLWYNEEILAEDTDLFARVAFTLKTANLPDSLLSYRREDYNLSLKNLKHKNKNNVSLAVIQSIELEQSNLQLLYHTLNEHELKLIETKPLQNFTYGDALNIFRYRLGRSDLSELLPADPASSRSIFLKNIGDRIPVIWGYGWNGQVLEYTLQEMGYSTYRIIDQRIQELGQDADIPHMLNIEKLEGNSNCYYVVISMDRRFQEVSAKLQSYGYKPQEDYIEYFIPEEASL